MIAPSNVVGIENVHVFEVAEDTVLSRPRRLPPELSRASDMYVNGPVLPLTSILIVTESPLRYWLLSNVRTRVIPADELTTNVSDAVVVGPFSKIPSARRRNGVPS